MKSQSQNLLTPYERKSKIVSDKNIVSYILFCTEVIAKYTEEIISSMEEKDFISIINGQRFPDKFFEEFLEK